MKSLLATWLCFAAIFSIPIPALTDDFVGKDIQKQDRSGQNLEGSDFTDANCFLTNFRDAKLSKSTFRDANLTSATFSGAQMKQCDLRGATLTNSSFQEADLSKANLEGLDLTSASFQNAKLRGAKLHKAKGFTDCTKADFREADLRGANLLGMKDYGGTTAKFTGAKYDKATRWPNGFDVEGSGAVLVGKDEAEDGEEAAAKPKAKTKSPAEASIDESTDDDAKEAVAAKSPVGAPPEKTIKNILEKEMWGPPSQGGTKHTYEYKSFKIAAPREGNFRTDGTPANKKTMIFPVKLEVIVTREFTDGVTREETKKQSYNFFKDEFGDWTYRFVQNH
jgi:hypothetical protein